MKTKEEIRKAIQTLKTGRTRYDDFTRFDQEMSIEPTEGLGSIIPGDSLSHEIWLLVEWKALRVVRRDEEIDNLCENFANSLHQHWYGELSSLLHDLKFHIDNRDAVMSRKLIDEILKKIGS